MKMKPAPGPVEVCNHSWSDTSIFDVNRNVLCSLSIDDDETTEDNQEEREGEMDAHARFIAEAFNVHHETGLSPRELLEQRDGLAEAVVAMLRYYAPASFDTVKYGNEDALRYEVKIAHAALAAIAATRETKGEG